MDGAWLHSSLILPRLKEHSALASETGQGSPGQANASVWEQMRARQGHGPNELSE